jgi:glutathione-regulated potassium-efflux system ancillary protein KefC
MEHGQWLTITFTYLAAAVIAVPLSRALGLGTIIGYLAAGIVIGPWGLRLVTEPETILGFAEFGVVLMLFLVGLELEPRRLWSMRRPIFGWGTVQLAGCALLLFGVGMAALAAMGVHPPWQVLLVGSLALAMSSTAIGLSVLAERNELPTGAGQGVLSVSLFQDMSAIPVLALIPLLALAPGAGGEGGAHANPWLGAAEAIATIVAIILGGRLLLRPFLRWIAGSKTPEIFTAASLALVVGIASLMQAVGLSMALGAFLAGVLLAESEYRRELETDLEPFKGLLLGLFFMAVGMGIDFAVVMNQPLAILAMVVGFIVLKAAVLAVMARLMPLPLLERSTFIILLAQGGEFGFVVLQTASGAAVIDATTASIITAAITVSMMLTPLLLLLADRYWVPRLEGCLPAKTMDEIAEPQNAPIIIAGFGRYGQIVGRLLFASGLKATVLEHDADVLDSLRKWGWRVFYGDATRLDLLRIAGAPQAKVLVIAIDDMGQSLKLADIAREHFPHLTIVARARNVQHYYQLKERGVTLIERETLDSALMSGRSVLEAMGFQRHQARTLAMIFRRHSIELIEAAAPHFRDESKLISMVKAGRAQLEQMFALERQGRGGSEQTREGWHPVADASISAPEADAPTAESTAR